MKVALIALCCVCALLAQAQDVPTISAANTDASGRNASRQGTINLDFDQQLPGSILDAPFIGLTETNLHRASSRVSIAQLAKPETEAAPQDVPASSVDKSGNVTFRGKITSEETDAKRMGTSYDVLAYGADPTGKTDSTAALQLAIDKAGAAPVVLPAGKYVISAPLMCYTLQGAERAYVAGCKIEGTGLGKTQLLLSPTFNVPPSVEFHGITVHVTPAAIDIQGVLDTASFGSFQNGGEVSRLEIAPEGCEVNRNPGEPRCAYTPSPPWMTGGANGIAGISIEGAWTFDIHDNYIHFMSGDGIFFPERLDIAGNGDLAGSNAAHIYHNNIKGNEGWGINLSGITAGDDIDQNLIIQNSLGGIRVTALFNRIMRNSIALNGCGQKFAGTVTKSISCTTLPLGPGIYIGRDFGGWSGGPYGDTIEENGFDSNAAEQVDVSTATNLIVRHNLFFTHTTGYVYNNTFPGAQNIPKQQILLGDVSAVNVAIEYNMQRADFACAAGHPVPSAGCHFPNAELDPEVAAINFIPNQNRSTYVNQNVLRGNVHVGNYQPYVQGAGMVAGEPEMSPVSGSPARQSVVSWPLVDGGIGFVTAPGLTAVGGDSAWRQPTLLMLTQREGSLATCEVEQGGGPYNRPPITSVQDADGSGSGGAISLSLSGAPGSYTARSCTITSAGSGYGHPMGGVAPVCAKQPVVSAIPSRGIGEIKISNGGNYGPWIPGAVPPSVTASIHDATGTGYEVIPIMAPVNTNIDPRTAPAVHWQVVGVSIKSRGYNSTAPTIIFSASPGQTAATAAVAMGRVLNRTLKIVDPGSCDAGATPWLVASLPAYPSRNHELNAVYENNVIMSAPDVKGARTQAVDEAGADPGPAGNSAMTQSDPGWNISFTAEIPTPRSDTTYYISTNSVISASTDKASTWPASAPFSCTLSSVQYLASMQGARDSQADDFILRVYDLTSDRAFDDTAARVALNASSYPTVPQLFPSDAISRGDKLLLEVKTPPSYGKQPTNVNLAGQIWCR